VNFGKEIIETYKDRPDDRDVYTALICLLDIENLLDLGRTLVEESDGRLRQTINSGMDEIRSEILLLMKKLDKAKIQTSLNYQAEQLKTNFVGSL
jgi:hypothetical protein